MVLYTTHSNLEFPYHLLLVFDADFGFGTGGGGGGGGNDFGFGTGVGRGGAGNLQILFVGWEASSLSASSIARQDGIFIDLQKNTH